MQFGLKNDFMNCFTHCETNNTKHPNSGLVVRYWSICIDISGQTPQCIEGRPIRKSRCLLPAAEKK